MKAIEAKESAVQEALENGKAETYDLEMIMEYSILDLLPQECKQIKVMPNLELVEMVQRVEPFSAIPWIDTSKVVFIEITRKILTSPKTLNKERGKFKQTDLTQAEIDSVFESFKQEARNDPTRTEPFLFVEIKPEEDHGVLCTQIDGQYAYIYSIATDVPANKKLLYQYVYFKSVLSCLLKEVPLGRRIRRLEFAYHIVGIRLFMFICIQ